MSGASAEPISGDLARRELAAQTPQDTALQMLQTTGGRPSASLAEN
jgi:hypothetical protein